ncbi:hypothetical protein G7L40_20655 [Paenibacillus polymyxa]|uniref:Uncharacterized protein n=1 Tax=Paenibacillus polymyxa TaxID=1406 RepID=A0A378XZB7_PAEPO|nr:hypothetical protein [Paenibacillus polymyxa]MBE7896095.1 hypothetical protein [Paenibacillus polymyxa]MBG9765957.1 hypothetical protein [Paenibacillus polymyxa]MCC3256629.1 hypothetical protein [Paenibacillus polymyxa]QPK54883.1 hypothetical protein G7035_20710 [Paenibacillus polymyxa]QPK59971.1 hypothetical protein G7L40_20655 [Paenibacillus polymyxa]
MNHLEFRSKAKIGEEVWICDYRYNDVDNKAIRHIPPKKVVVVNNEDLPKNKRVYYSEFHFRELKESGKLSSTVIAPYDNTGYRAYTGVSLNIFYDKEECIKHYLNQCVENLKQFDDAKVKKNTYYSQKIDEINQEIMKLI